MTQIATLSNESHRSLRVDARPSAAYGDSQCFAQVVVGEFAHVVVHYAILFAKEAATGRFYCGVLLGYDKGENLFLDDWRAGSRYRPLLLQRAPFLTYGRYVAIDLDHPRVGVEAGEPLFTDDGRPTPYLERVRHALSQLHAGMRATQEFIARLLALRLIEPIDLQVELDDGSRREGTGLYTIDVDALAALEDAKVVELHRRGYLRLIDFMIASLKQLPVLASRKNARLLRGTEALARMQPFGHG